MARTQLPRNSIVSLSVPRSSKTVNLRYNLVKSLYAVRQTATIDIGSGKRIPWFPERQTTLSSTYFRAITINISFMLSRKEAMWRNWRD